MTDKATENHDAPQPLGLGSTDGLGPLVPAAWMEPGRHWTLEPEEWMAHHRKDLHPNVQATLAAKTECLYRLTPDDVAAVNAARKEAAWSLHERARDNTPTPKCPHCGHEMDADERRWR